MKKLKPYKSHFPLKESSEVTIDQAYNYLKSNQRNLPIYKIEKIGHTQINIDSVPAKGTYGDVGNKWQVIKEKMYDTIYVMDPDGDTYNIHELDDLKYLFTRAEQDYQARLSKTRGQS